LNIVANQNLYKGLKDQKTIQPEAVYSDKRRNSYLLFIGTNGGEGLVHQNITAGVESIQDNLKVIRAKFRPLLDQEAYVDDVTRLIDVIPQMLDNLEAMSAELDNAFNVLSKAPKKESA
jgi:hypothetical protein